MKAEAKNRIMIAAAIVLIASWSFWVNLRRSRANARERASASTADVALTEAFRQAERRLAAAERMRVETEEALARSSKSLTTDSKPAIRLPTSQSEIIADQPALQVLELKRQRAAIRQEDGDFFRERGWSSEQFEKYVELRLAYTERTMDLRDIARTQDEPGKQTVLALQAKAKEEYDATRRALLGEAVDREFQTYSQTTTLLQNFLVRGLAGVAALEGVPLSADQGDRLIKAAVEAMSADSGVPIQARLKTTDWGRFEGSAREILSTKQLKLFSTQDPPSGFGSRAAAELQAAIERAQRAETAK